MGGMGAGWRRKGVRARVGARWGVRGQVALSQAHAWRGSESSARASYPHGPARPRRLPPESSAALLSSDTPPPPPPFFAESVSIPSDTSPPVPYTNVCRPSCDRAGSGARRRRAELPARVGVSVDGSGRRARDTQPLGRRRRICGAAVVSARSDWVVRRILSVLASGCGSSIWVDESLTGACGGGLNVNSSMVVMLAGLTIKLVQKQLWLYRWRKGYIVPHYSTTFLLFIIMMQVSQSPAPSLACRPCLSH